MKKYTAMLLVVLLTATMLAGCRRNEPAGTDGSTVPSTSSSTTASTAPVQTGPSATQNSGPANQSKSRGILETIWAEYAEDERFAAYGGTVDQSVSDAPGDLDMTNTEELTTAYLLPREQLSAVEEGASLVHMMNNNIFTSAVFKIAEGTDQKTLFEAWRDTIQQNHWICGQPDRLLMANVDGQHMLMAFGSKEAMETFKGKVSALYSEAEILYDGAVVV